MSITSKASNAEMFLRVLGSFGREDVQTTQGPLWFVTNGLCEPAYWNAGVFDHYGAGYQKSSPYYGGETPYPLTRAEEVYVSPDGLLLPHYYTDLRLGYTVWWKAQKWVCPTLEYSYASASDQSRGDEEPGEDLELRGFVEHEAERLHAHLHPVQGTVLLDLHDLSDRYVLHLLVPMSVLIATFPRVEDWHQFLLNLFPATESSNVV